MKNFIKLYSRRSFIKIGALLGLQFVPGYSSDAAAVTGKPKHHTAEGFRNYPVGKPAGKGSFGFGFRRFKGSFFLPDVPPGHFLSEKEAVNRFKKLEGKNTLTWLGQSTFLLRIGDKIVLTDPFFAECASPFAKVNIGPMRFVRPGIGIKNLPCIDIMIISHNHYDHLDADAVESLPGKGNIRVFVPPGLKPFFAEKGYKHVKELDWNESSSFEDIRMTALPAVHFSGRWINDKNRTLWCSWSIISRSGRYYFAGDTAYSHSIFKNIGKKYKSFDLAMVPIGAYKPRDFMRAYHTTPEEAVDIGMDINAGIIAGMHWGTIELSDEPHFEPPELFRKAALKTGIPPERVWVMRIGETRVIPKKKYQSK